MAQFPPHVQIGSLTFVNGRPAIVHHISAKRDNISVDLLDDNGKVIDRVYVRGRLRTMHSFVFTEPRIR